MLDTINPLTGKKYYYKDSTEAVKKRNVIKKSEFIQDKLRSNSKSEEIRNNEGDYTIKKQKKKPSKIDKNKKLAEI